MIHRSARLAGHPVRGADRAAASRATVSHPAVSHLAVIALAAACALPACGKKAADAGAAPGNAAGAPEADEKREAAVDAGLAVPEGARVFFVAPADGATVEIPAGPDKGKVHVVFGVEGMSVKPAGEVVAGTGHHHLIINAEGTEFGQPVPKNDTHIHYGAGQTEADVELAAGDYTLTMQFANGAHLSYGDKMRASIKVKVKAADPIAAEAAAADAAAPAAGDNAVAPAGDAPAPSAAAPGIADPADPAAAAPPAAAPAPNAAAPGIADPAAAAPGAAVDDAPAGKAPPAPNAAAPGIADPAAAGAK